MRAATPRTGGFAAADAMWAGRYPATLQTAERSLDRGRLAGLVAGVSGHAREGQIAFFFQP